MKQPLDGLSAIAMLAVASFAIDRIVAGAVFLLTLVKPEYENPVPGSPGHVPARKTLKLFYVVVAGVLAILVMVLYPNLRILNALGVQADRVLDSVLTAIVLLGGSDQLAILLKTIGVPEIQKPAPQPIQINGRLVLEEPAKAKVQAAA